MKKYPLLLLLIVSGVLLTGFGFLNRNGRYREYEQARADRPVLSVVFTGAADGVYPWSSPEEEAAPVMARPAETVPEKDEEAGTDERQDGADGLQAALEEPNRPVPAPGKEPSRPRPQPAEEETEEETEQEEETEYAFSTVEESYFDDALFIGDSRTQGMLEYGKLPQGATFYCKTSLTVFDLFKHPKAFIREGEEKKTLEEALKEHQFGKIYLMLGINELGTGTPDYFYEEYASVVQKLRELEPDAILFVQGIMHVGSQKNETDPVFNNTRIEQRNEKIRALEDKKNIFYLDVNEVLCDENGNLFDGWTFDQVHLKAKYYQLWKEYLLQHGILKEDKAAPKKKGAAFL